MAVPVVLLSNDVISVTFAKNTGGYKLTYGVFILFSPALLEMKAKSWGI